MPHIASALRQPPLYTSERWQAYCTDCGWFGPICDNKPDAEAIADRHHEVQGFER